MERLLSSQVHHVELQLILTRLVAQHHMCSSGGSGACIFVQCQLYNALLKKKKLKDKEKLQLVLKVGYIYFYLMHCCISVSGD